MLDNISAALPAHLGVNDRRLAGRTRHADIHRRGLHHAPRNQAGLQQAMCGIGCQHIILAHLAVLQRHCSDCAMVPARAFATAAECRQLVINGQAFGIAADQYRHRARTVGNLRLHNEQPGHRCIRNKRREAVERPAFAVALGNHFGRPDHVGIRRHRVVVAPADFGILVTCDQRQMKTLAGFEFRQPAFALRVIHGLMHGTRQHGGLAQDHRQIDVAGGNFFQQHAAGQQISTRTARHFRHCQAAQPHL